jgi:hypothetical protein
MFDVPLVSRVTPSSKRPAECCKKASIKTGALSLDTIAFERWFEGGRKGSHMVIGADYHIGPRDCGVLAASPSFSRCVATSVSTQNGVVRLYYWR